MNEPYPNKIHKIKIIILILLFLALSLGMYCLKNHTEIFLEDNTQLLILQILQYLLLAAIFIFNLKMFTIQNSLEYLYLFCGAVSFLFFQMSFDFYIKHNTPTNMQFFHHLNFVQIGCIIFYIFLFLAVFSMDRIIEARNRKRKNIKTATLVILCNAIFFILLKYFMLRFPLITKLNVSTIDVFMVIGAIILLIAGIKILRLFLQTRHHHYFWYIFAILFLFFSEIYSIPHQLTKDSWTDASLLLQVIGLVGLVWIPFLKNSKFLETEIELRNDLEQSLFKSEQESRELNKIFNGLDAGICILEKNGQISFFNEKFNFMLSGSKKQLKNLSDKVILNKTNFEKFQIEREKLKSGKTCQFEIELSNRLGKVVPVMIVAAPILNKLRRYNGCWLAIFEMTEKRDIERKLKDYSENLERTIKEKTSDLHAKTEELSSAKKYYESLIAGMSDILLVVDKKGNCNFINEYGQKLLGYQAKQLTRKRLPNFLADLDRLHREYGDAMKVELRDYEAPLKTKTGRTILCNWNARYLFDGYGKNIGAMCLGRDISEYKALQKKLEAHSKDLEKLVSQRTLELKAQVNQISKILKIEEELALNIEPKKFLSNLCKTVKSIGWQVVIFTTKDELSNEFKVTAYEGIEKTRIRKFVYDRDFLYKDVFKYVRDEFKISKSYLVRDFKVSLKKSTRIFDSGNNEIWGRNDALIIPVKIKTKFLGFMTLFSPKDKKIPQKQAIQVLEIFAHKAAVALENRRLYTEAKTQAQELSKATKIKTNFFTTMSHELRTPLNSVISLTDVLLKGMSGKLNAEQLKQVKIIRQNGNELLKLINNLLDFSKIDANKMEVNYTYFPITKLINENLDTVRPLCRQKNVQLQSKKARNLPKYIFSDLDKITRILSNVLSNAVKFTHQGKIKLDVKFDKKPGTLQITVTDTGIGMSNDQLEKIFLSFKQVRNVDRRKYQGTGLGLTISKRMVDLMGGTISVESKKGKGTTFHFSIPVKDFSDEDNKIIEKPESNRKGKNQKKPTKNKGRKKPLILLVDDNKDNQYAVKFILEEQGYRIVFASNGKQGIKQALKQKPDLILMDLMMPGIDGYKATQKIRENSEMKKTPIIAMTAKTIQEDKKRAIKAGCNEYLGKPFTLDSILAKVEKWLGG
ncbi:response regulator [candidate division KSB1 bacterium]|nr:response regulator [candidate division KSB1 bacterium]